MKKLNVNAQGSALNRNELKKVLGGVLNTEWDSIDGSSGGRCLSNLGCYYEESPGRQIAGYCTTNSNGKCVCNATTSSVLFEQCVA